MANTPTPRSYSQVLGDMIDIFLSHYGLNSIKTGSPILSVFESAAQSQLRSSEDIFTLLQSQTLDRATGTALDRIGADEDAPRLTQTPASGFVNFNDTSFNKISSKVFQGTPAPIIGTTALNIQDGTPFATSGTVYIGRGTQNYEGPIPYSSVVNNGTYWTINLTQPTILFHNQNETVIMGQGGNRSVPASTVVQTQQGASANAVTFTTLYAANIPDGEVLVANVVVVAQIPGTSGNVAKNGIQLFTTAPFTGASVTNPLPFTNGIDTEDDDTYRERIRLVRQSRAKATSIAITTNAIGVTSTDDNKRVTSASVIQIQGQPATLYIDDGTGYEEISDGVAIESFSDFALGGEQSFQVSASRPVTKAYLEAIDIAPWVLETGMQLALTVGGVTTSHTFSEDEFRNVNNATAYEIVTSINNDAAILWSARTTQSGNSFAVFAKADTNEDIQVATPDGIDANQVFDFPIGRVDTMSLYRNDRLLNKDGKPAEVASRSFSNWNTLSGTQTLVLLVDGIQLNFDGSQFPAFSGQDFIDAETGFTTLGQNTLTAWAEVFNFRIPGITAAVSNGLIVLTSNKGSNTNSKISIISGSLVTNHMFDPNKAVTVGQNSDYTLNRNTGMFSLDTPLVAGDKLAAGSVNTRAFLQGPSYAGTVNIPADANMWFSVDGDATVIQTGLSASSALVVTAPYNTAWANRVRIASATSADLFANVELGDWVVFSDTNVPNIKGAYKVASVDTGGTYFEIEKTAMTSARFAFASCKLADGKIFVCGGFAGANSTEAVNSAEVFDPITKQWSSLPTMTYSRAYHTATLLANGNVLVVGGTADGTMAGNQFTSEIYSPSTVTWNQGPNFGSTGFAHHSAIQLGAGFTAKTLILGGINTSATFLTACWLYDDAANTATATGSMSTAHAYHTTNILNTGIVLVAGGQSSVTLVTSDCELYNPSAGTWSVTANLITFRQSATSVVLPSGNVLVIGGSTSPGGVAPIASTEEYASGNWTSGPNMNTSAVYHNSVLLTNGDVVRVGGVVGNTSEQTEVLSGSTWSVGANPIDAASIGLRDLPGAFEISANNVLMFGGQSNAAPFSNIATAEIYNQPGNTWSVPESAVHTSFNLATNGIAFVRSNGPLEHVTIPAGASYTAPTLVAAINDYFDGATAAVYRTTSIRTSTNTFAQSNGDIALVAADVNSNLIEIPVGDATKNLSGHLASVESANGELGTPEFRQVLVTGSASPTQPYIVQSANGGSISPLFVSQSLVGLRDRDESATVTRYGNHFGFNSHIHAVNGTELTLDQGVDTAWMPKDRVYLANTFAIGSNDDLTVVANNDPTDSRFTIQMGRTIFPINATYGSQNTFRDSDNGNKTLAAGFGLNYDFNDFAVFMSARTQSDISDSTKTVVWRNLKLGPDGNTSRIHYALPTAPNQGVAVTVDPTSSSFTNISVTLASGALKTNISLQPTNKIGLACTNDASGNGLATVAYILGFPIASASRTANVTTLTLTLPSGITDCGLTNGDTIYVQSTNGNFGTGAFTLQSGSGATVTYPEPVLADQGATANIGFISNGISSATTTGASPAVAVDDFFRFENALNSTDPLYSQFTGQTMRIASLPNNQTIVGRLENFTDAVNTTVRWYVVNDTSAFKVFLNLKNTASTIVTAVNALTPQFVKAALGGAGTGLITTSSADSNNMSPFWYQMTDGMNYVETTISPVSIGGDYQLVFKNPVNAALATNSDWADEELRLVPVTTKNIVEWLNTPAVTGLFTDCSIQNSSQGQKIQVSSTTAGSIGAVQVQGGLANSSAAPVVGAAFGGTGYCVVNINSALADGFYGGMWTAVNNTQNLPKAVFDSNSNLTSITNNTDQTATFVLNSGGTPVWAHRNAPSSNAVVQVEAQGRFTAYSSTALGLMRTSSVQEGDWVSIEIPAAPSGTYAEIESVNTGIFRVVRVDTGLDSTNGTIWVENLDASGNSRVSPQGLAECDIIFFTPDSMMPGDTIQISTSLWNALNKGVFTVVSVGKGSSNTSPAFTDAFSFDVSTAAITVTNVSVSPGALGNQAGLVQCIEQFPARYIKRVQALAPHATDPNLYTIKFDSSQAAGRINATAGSIVNSLDKLGFPTTTTVGIDGYAHSVGLIGEVNRVLYGDASDPDTYPGTVALGTVVNISGPLVKRIEVSLQVRVRTGVQTVDVESLVKSAVASLINGTGIGEPISFSDIIDAASAVQGVVAVTIISPTYNASNDTINVGVNVKPLVLDADVDILISFVGN